MPALQVSPRSVAVAAVVLTLLALFASRPASAEGEEPQGLAIEGAGVGLRGARYRAPSDPLPAALPAVVAAVVHNPNVGFAAEGVRVRLTVYDADERAIGGTVFDLPQVLPRERRGITADISVPRDALPVVRVAAEVEALTRWVPVREVPLLEVGRVVAYPGFHGDLVGGGAIALPFAAGVLSNPLDAALGEVMVVGVVYDQAGHVVGGAQRRLPYVAPLGTATASPGTLIYGTDIESRTLVGASWGRVELFAAYPWIDLAPYRR